MHTAKGEGVQPNACNCVQGVGGIGLAHERFMACRKCRIEVFFRLIVVSLAVTSPFPYGLKVGLA